MLSYTRKKEAQVQEKICMGEVQANPYELKGSTGCDYCDIGISAGLIQGWTDMSIEVGSVFQRRSHPKDGDGNRKRGGAVMSVQWTKDQQKVIELRNRNILVSAAAGPERLQFLWSGSFRGC